MSVNEIIALILGSSAVSAAVTAWATVRSKNAEIQAKKDDILHLSEVEFRKVLVERVRQLEDLAARDTRRIRELEDENRALRAEVEKLRRGQ